jgi:O-antigen ligase
MLRLGRSDQPEVELLKARVIQANYAIGVKSTARRRAINRAVLAQAFAALSLIVIAGDQFTYLDQFMEDRKPLLKAIALPAAFLALACSDWKRLARARISLPYVGFVGLILASIVWSPDRHETVFFAKIVALPVVLLVVTLAMMERTAIVNGLRRFALGLIAFTALDCIAFSRARSGLTTDALNLVVQPGFRGSFGHKNVMAITMVVLSCIVMATEKRRLVRLVTVAVGLTLVVLTRSGTGIGCLVVPFSYPVIKFAMGARDRRGQAARVVLAVSGVFAAMVGAYLSIGLVLDALGKDRTYSSRTAIWQSVAIAIRKRPIFGYGWSGVFASPDVEPTYSINRRIGFRAAHAHSGPMMLLLQLGVVGLLWMLFMLFQLLSESYRQFRAGNRHGGFLIASILGTLIVASSAEPMMSSTALMWLLVVYAITVHQDLGPAVAKPEPLRTSLPRLLATSS